jgi:hypothetical protein
MGNFASSCVDEKSRTIGQNVAVCTGYAALLWVLEWLVAL